MFVPIHDENTLRSIRWPIVTYGLIALNAIVFLIQMTGIGLPVITSFGVVPAELRLAALAGTMTTSPPGGIAVPEGLTLITYMFFHADPIHLGSNMLFLWVFGDNVEDDMGHGRFLLFYMLCGIAAGLLHSVMLPESRTPLIGASGAVAGAIAAYLMVHPRVRVWVLAFRVIPLRISAAFVLGIWIATQIVMVLIPQQGPVAWWAHIGGLVAGAVLVIVFRRPGVGLFGRTVPVG